MVLDVTLDNKLIFSYSPKPLDTQGLDVNHCYFRTDFTITLAAIFVLLLLLPSICMMCCWLLISLGFTRMPWVLVAGHLLRLLRLLYAAITLTIFFKGGDDGVSTNRSWLTEH